MDIMTLKDGYDKLSPTLRALADVHGTTQKGQNLKF
jgi:hypothetical protein